MTASDDDSTNDGVRGDDLSEEVDSAQACAGSPWRS